MAQMKPGFITGANAKVKAFDQTLAYCSDVSYNITVQTIPIESMGKYEVHANEPVAYTVDGTFSVIRYTGRAKTSGIANVSEPGNAPSEVGDSAARNLAEHMDPAKLLLSETFDLEIYEKRPGEGNEQGVFRINDCRLTRRGTTLNKRGVMVDNYAFVGIIAEDTDDTYVAGPSGDEDLS
jgi:hypothetical protein